MPGGLTTSPRPTIVITTVALATVSSVFPGLASGSLAVQASEDLGISEGAWGWTISAFFVGSASMSIVVGRLAQRIGARRQLLATTLSAGIVQLLIATSAPNFETVLGLLVVAGAINAATQTAVNLALSQAGLPRLGVAMATKQSAMPTAAMLGGLAVPAVALTLGWRWAYVLGAVIAVLAAIGVFRVVAPGAAPQTAATREAESPSRLLIGVALVCFLLAFTSGAINAWTVASGVDAGLGEGAAGFALSGAAALGIAMRLTAGTRLDGLIRPCRSAAWVYLVGIAGFALLAVRTPALHVLAGLLAFGGGWIWPAFTNFAIVRANPHGAARATGITQTGVYLGVMSGPAITGLVVDGPGYPTMWILVAGVGAVALVGLLLISPHLDHASTDSPRPQR